MNPSSPLFRLAALVVGGVLSGGLAIPGAANASRGAMPVAQTLAHVEISDRVTGSVLPVFEHDGRHYIVGHPGHEYAIRIRNTTGQRILAVTSVDGVNVISGETATPFQSGYVLEPWATVEIAGWRKSLSRTAAFFFTEHAASYATRTGRPFDVGVIGVALFAERVARPPVRISDRAQGAASGARREVDAEIEPPPVSAAPMAPPPAAADSAASAERQRDHAQPRERAVDARPAIQPLAKLGTGHGRSETSLVRLVAFERASSEPAHIVAILYDRHENLAASGILRPPPRHHAGRAPAPFPGLRFAPDPR